MKIKVSDYIAKRLSEHYGVKDVFMVSGGGAMHLNNSFGKYFHVICNHHEQGAAIAAEGYARSSGSLAVVNVTTGPGGLNAMNGLFGQWTDSVPVLYISGQVKFSTCKSSCPDIPLRQLGDQEVDIISVVKPLTKYAEMIKDPREVKWHLDRAIRAATTGRKGPVWLDVPMNVQAAIIDDEDLKEYSPAVIPSEDCLSSINELFRLLKKSSRPLIIAGQGIRLSGQLDNFSHFIKKTNLPVAMTFCGCDQFSSTNSLNIGSIGTIGQRAANFILQCADLIISLGSRNNIRQVSYNWENFGKNAKKVFVDIDQAELIKPLVKADLAIQADLNDFIPALSNKILQENYVFSNKKWLDFILKLKNIFSFENTKEYKEDYFGNLINPYYFTHLLTSKLHYEDVLVSANATPSICIFQAGVFSGQRVLMNSGDASMGYSLPCSIGASLKSKGKVICCEGDGSIMMNLQELQTIVYNKLPIKIFVFCNDGYSSIRQSQKNFFNGVMTGSGPSSGVSVPDFQKIAQAFGIPSLTLSDNKSINSTIDRVLSSEGPFLCQVVLPTDYSFTPKLSARSLPDGSMVSPSLEDMYPFIDRSLFESIKKEGANL